MKLVCNCNKKIIAQIKIQSIIDKSYIILDAFGFVFLIIKRNDLRIFIPTPSS